MYTVRRLTPYSYVALQDRANAFEAIAACNRFHSDGQLTFIKEGSDLVARVTEGEVPVTYTIKPLGLSHLLAVTKPVIADSHYEEVVMAAREWESQSSDWDYNLWRLNRLVGDRPDRQELML